MSTVVVHRLSICLCIVTKGQKIGLCGFYQNVAPDMFDDEIREGLKFFDYQTLYLGNSINLLLQLRNANRSTVKLLNGTLS